MVRTGFIGIAVVSAMLGSAEAETLFETGRRAYATLEAGEEYCPDIEPTWTARASIREASGYDPLIDDAELNRLQAQKAKLFAAFRELPRQVVCEYLMQEFGPGGQLHLFQFR